MTKHAEDFTLEPGVAPTPTLPAITSLTRPFWGAAAEGRLLLPRCNACGQHFFRPEVACTHCFATDWQWVEASGRGTLYSHSVVHRAPAPGFAVPFVLAVVELEEGPVMFSNLVGCDVGGIGDLGAVEDGGAVGTLRIGMALKARFEQVAAGIWLPRFEAA
jgi:uncharacterized OB-fold protein